MRSLGQFRSDFGAGQANRIETHHLQPFRWFIARSSKRGRIRPHLRQEFLVFLSFTLNHISMFKTDVFLRPYSHYKIGGAAKHFCEAKTYDHLARDIAAWRLRFPNREEFFKNTFVLGGGTNLLISDDGYPGLVVKPAFRKISSDGFLVRVDAGAAMADLVDFASRKSLSGLEWAGGLPGTLGGAIRGNAGCFGGEMKDVIASVKSLDIGGKTPRLRERANRACRFGYRTSVFKELDASRGGKEIILSAVLRLTRGDPRQIREAVEEKIRYREARHPVEYPNIGSIFKNIPISQCRSAGISKFRNVVKNDPFPVVPVAAVIAETGLKGVSFGGAMISPKHPNFIVNVLDAKASEVKTLIELVKYTVRGKFGIELEEEVVYL